MKHRHVWRIKVELFLDIPIGLEHLINKKTLRSRDVKIDGANWPKSYIYCATCGLLSK